MSDKDKRKLSLVDVAERAGVSRSTVSRVVNNDDYVNEKTRARVLQVIKELGYVPNVAAQSLRTQRTHVIAVVIPDPLSNVFASDNPYYFSTIIQSISEVSQARDYAMLLWVGSLDGTREQLYESILKKRIMDGLILAASTEDERFFIEELQRTQLPFVMIGRPMFHPEQINYVSIDNVASARLAVEHLIARGRHRIATITGDWNNIDSRERIEGYRQALAAHGLPYDENLVKVASFARIGGYRQMKPLLEADIDAVFAGSDIIALGAIEAIHEAGLRIPDDIAVIGFDDIPDARLANPPLTTVQQPISLKAERATTMLLNIIDGEAETPQSILLPTDLIVRSSV